MPGITWIPALLTLALALPVLVLLAEALAALYLPSRGLPPTEDEGDPTAPPPRCAVLIPAHDEEKVLGATLEALRLQLPPGDRILVVADNCRDRTAALARGLGAEAAEREDPKNRGKGYALDYGLQVLRRDPPDIVVILDADCRPAPDFLEEIKKAVRAWKAPVQGLYRMKAPPGAGKGAKIAEFAWFFKTFVRQKGLHDLGLPCHLQGSGMAFPWKALEGVDLGGSELVEDLKLGLDLAASGRPARFHPGAAVESYFPSDRSGARTQRTRWEHGHLGLITRAFPRLLARALSRGDLGLAFFALDLAVPPLALLALLLGGIFLLDLPFALAGTTLPLRMCGIEILLFTGAVSLSWARMGQEILGWREILSIPIYVIGKIGLYIRFLRDRETSWVRTHRD